MSDDIASIISRAPHFSQRGRHHFLPGCQNSARSAPALCVLFVCFAEWPLAPARVSRGAHDQTRAGIYAKVKQLISAVNNERAAKAAFASLSKEKKNRIFSQVHKCEIGFRAAPWRMNCREMLVTFATPLNFGATPAHKMYISSAGGASN